MTIPGIAEFKEAAQATKPAQNKGVENFDLTTFCLNGRSSEMEKKMLDDKFVLSRIAIQGQSTAIYAGPNMGKTLLAMWMLRDAITRGEINGSDVFYINADDTYKGLVYKLKFAEDNGFNMLAPGHNGFKAGDLPVYLQKMIETGTAHGKILILDTVKKFTDLMRKDKASKFSEQVRQFVSHGGTVIMLAHINKHRDDDNQVVYSGTTDLVDDCDCAYTLDQVSADGRFRVVKFQNFKARGDVAREAVYRYDYADGTPYHARLNSVEEVGKEEQAAAERKKQLQKTLEKNRLAVDAILECLREGTDQKTALVKEAAARSGISKPKIGKALLDHTGSNSSENQFWYSTVGARNSITYHLNYGAF